MNKRGQFFLLAAVIISVIVLGIGAISNQARVSEEPRDFFDSAENIESESVAVVDYLVYNEDCESAVETCPEDINNVSSFIDEVSKGIRDNEPNSDLVVLYGNSSEFFIENHGAREITYTCGSEVDKKIPSRDFEPVEVTEGPFETETRGNLRNVERKKCSSIGEIEILIEGEEHLVNFSENSQVVFLIRKELGDEVYVSS